MSEQRSRAHSAGAGMSGSGRGASGAHVTVLVPAHNEEDRIGAALESLHRQTRRQD